MARGTLLLALLAAVALALFPARAAAAPNLLVGIDDDSGKWSDENTTALALRGLGVRSQRISVAWTPGHIDVNATEGLPVVRALSHGWALRAVVGVSASPDNVPQTDAARDQFCAFARSILIRFPMVNDVVIANEVNKSAFWRPQFSPGAVSLAPAAYELLLARCYDILHAYRASVNVITSTSSRGNDDAFAVSNVSHSPGAFLRKLGQAYRTTGRTTPIFDTVGHNPYPLTSAERPWRVHHDGQTIGEGDYASLMQALYDGFSDTGQPLPGQGRVGIWYLEDGFQTTVDPSKASFYSGTETEGHTLPASSAGDRGGLVPEKSKAPDQGTQLVDAVRLAYCQPAVTGFFNFMAFDEPRLAGWQSGLLWADGTRKPSYDAFRGVNAEVAQEHVDCSRLKGGPVPAFVPQTSVAVASLAWKRESFSIRTAETATFDATLLRDGKATGNLHGTLREEVPAVVRFPSGRLPAGRYRIALRLTSAANPARRRTLVSSSFVVGPVFRVVPS